MKDKYRKTRRKTKKRVKNLRAKSVPVGKVLVRSKCCTAAVKMTKSGCKCTARDMDGEVKLWICRKAMNTSSLKS